MSDWVIKKIGDLGIVITGKTPSTKVMENFEGPYPFITIPDLDGRVYINSSARTLSEIGAKSIRSSLIPPGAIMMSCIATIGRCGITIKPSFTNQQINSLIPYGQIDSRFIFYIFTQLVNELEASGGGGSVYTNVSKNRFSDIEIAYPSDLREQHAIAHILGTLDEKIELNRRMNETLEGIARALFKSWFIDFDPVHAKAEGRQPFGMNEETAALFPDQFEDSELGEIPKGWAIGSIYDIADVRYGAPFSSKLFNTESAGFPLIRIRDLESQTPVVFTQERINRDTVIRAGDIIVGMDGEFKVTTWYGPDSLLNQRVCSFGPKEGVPRFFLKYSIENPISYFERSKVGTTVIHLGKADIDSIRILEPDAMVFSNFEAITKDIYNLIIYYNKQNNILMNIKDSLLPKLISGDIRVDPSKFGFGPEGEKVGEV